eukprot:GHVP01043477.1.p1 GENE.GHVP01043477.1~~GHVP01043477.1.p1  ORF type:complete len:258 (+),score=58.24 GHVP01043477.1:36-776(+)
METKVPDNSLPKYKRSASCVGHYISVSRNIPQLPEPPQGEIREFDLLRHKESAFASDARVPNESAIKNSQPQTNVKRTTTSKLHPLTTNFSASYPEYQTRQFGFSKSLTPEGPTNQEFKTNPFLGNCEIKHLKENENFDQPELEPNNVTKKEANFALNQTLSTTQKTQENNDSENNLPLQQKQFDFGAIRKSPLSSNSLESSSPVWYNQYILPPKSPETPSPKTNIHINQYLEKTEEQVPSSPSIH